MMIRSDERHYFLGIDGGGTKTAFRLVDAKGAVIRTVYAGASNPNDIGIERALAVLADGIRRACEGIPLACITAFAGIAGGGLTGDRAAQIRGFLEQFGFFAFENGSDIENLIGLAPCDDCVLVIMGTGFIVYSVKGEERKRISGWGQLFDEGGSGYTIGRDAIAAVLAETDGSGAPTALSTLLSERLGESAEMHLVRFYQGGKQYIASFADLVFRAASAGDAAARAILENNMRFAAQKIETALRCHACKVPVFFAGGISAAQETVFPLLKQNPALSESVLIRLDREPVEGALNRAKAIYEMKIKETMLQ